MSQPSNEPLQIENSLDVLLVLLYAPGKEGRAAEPIEGITRLQKLAFLLQQGEGPGTLADVAQRELKFVPYKMGPYAEGLQDDIDSLVSLGFVQTKRLRYLLTDDADARDDNLGSDEEQEKKKIAESLSYTLTGRGIDAAKELWTNMDDKSREGLTKFKSFFGSLSLRQLLIFVYEKYPKMTGKSEIRSQLGLY